MSPVGAPAAPDARFRLPLPPDWSDRPPAARAEERRARKAYFAALDALHSGRVNEDAVGKLARLVDDVRPDGTATRALRHLLRVFGYVRRVAAGWPVIPPPPAPLAAVRIGVPADVWSADAARLEARLAWALEWLRMRRYVAGKGVTIEWVAMAARVAAPAVAPAVGAVAPSAPGRRPHAGATDRPAIVHPRARVGQAA